MSFELFKKISSMLSPSQPIGVTPKKDNSYIESAGQQTVNAEMSTANTDNNVAQNINNMSKDISSVAKTVEVLDYEHSNSVYSNLLAQSKNFHDTASDTIKSSNDPDTISQASATNSAQQLGLLGSAKGLFPYQKEAIESAIHQYGQAGMQQATVKNSQIHAENYLHTIANSFNAQVGTVSTAFNNTNDPKEQKKIINQLVSQQKGLEDTRPYLTTHAQVTKLDALEGHLKTFASILMKPKPVYASTNITQAMQNNSSMAVHQSKAADEGVDNVLHGGSVNNFNESSIGSNPDYMNIYNSNVMAKSYLNIIASSPHILETLHTLKDKGGHVEVRVATNLLNLTDTGQADKLASLLNPDIKELQNKVGESKTTAEYNENNKNYQQSIKTFMDHTDLPDSAYDSMPTEIKSHISSTMNAEQTPENSQELYDRANATYKICGNKNTTLFGSSPQDNACREIRYQQGDKDGNLSYVQDSLDMMSSYSTDKQKSLKNNTDIFSKYNGKTSTEYKNIKGNSAGISSYKDVGIYISQNASDFGLSQMATLTGNSTASLISSIQARVAIKIKEGSSPDDAISSVQSSNMQILHNTPVTNGSSSYGKYSINPDTGNAYGLQGIDPSDMKEVMRSISSELYNKRIHGRNLITNDYSNNDIKNDKGKEKSNINSNTKVLGDVDNTHIYSSNGRMYIKYENGFTYPIPAGQIKLEADKFMAKKKSDSYKVHKNINQWADFNQELM